MAAAFWLPAAAAAAKCSAHNASTLDDVMDTRTHLLLQCNVGTGFSMSAGTDPEK